MALLPSASELDKLAEIDPEIGGILKHLPPSPLLGLEPVEMMMKMRAGFDSIPIPSPTLEVKEQQATYSTRDGTTLRLCIYKPATASSALPLVVWYHGGGGCIGRPEMNTQLYRTTALRQRCVVVAPQYRLAPEHKYPAGIQDSWDALQYIAANAHEVGASPKSGFVVGGESAGAVISAVLCLQARDNGLSPPLTGAFLSAGSFLNPQGVPDEYKLSYRSRTDPTCLNSPALGKETKAAFDACLQPDYSSPSYRAALSETGHNELPRTYFQSCGMDINRDESFIYRHILHESGVETRLDVYPGCPHCFWFAWGETSQGRKWERDTQDGLKWLLSAPA